MGLFLLGKNTLTKTGITDKLKLEKVHRPVTVRGITQRKRRRDMDMGEERKRTYHNLTEEVIRPPIWNWHEFLARWETTTSHQERMGLLHTGYTVPLEKRDWPEPKYDRADRDVFYLRISDGWEDARLLECRGDYSVRDYHLGYDEKWNLIRKTPRELRQILARKAFDLLCLNFFRRMEEPSGGGRLIRRERN